jgi:hypothetical protein
VTLLLVASVAINVWFFRRKVKPRKQSVRSTLIQGIKDVKELTTLRQNFQSVVMFKDSKALFGFSIPGTKRKFILKYDGVITCGNDLENIKITERFAVNNVRMIVPRSKIFDVYADMKSVQVYDQKAGLFTSIALSDQNREIANNLDEMWQRAMQSDILRRADENTRLILRSLAASLGMEAEVIFDDRGVHETIPAPAKQQTNVTDKAVAAEPEPVMIRGTEPEAVNAKQADYESTWRGSENITEP